MARKKKQIAVPVRSISIRLSKLEIVILLASHHHQKREREKKEKENVLASAAKRFL